MVNIHFNISKDLNKKLRLYSIKNDFTDKRLAIVKILEEKLNG